MEEETKPESTTDPHRRLTPNEAMMKAMESFGEDEPVDVVVIWNTQSGDLCATSTSPNNSTKIGLAEAMKAVWIHALLSCDDD